jgi:4-amino-4-deoxy-L-arabinose transferase-like glycosyltransferase
MGKTFSKIKSVLPFILLLLFILFLYSFRLDKVPVHLNQDELEFSLNAYSISQNLHDVSGKFLPFYLWHLGSFWATPVIVYLTAVFLKFLPISEAVIRLPSVLMGMVIIITMVILVHKIFKNKILTSISAILIATTPVLFIHSRLLLDNLYPVPFVLLWLIFLKNFLDKKRKIFLLFSGLSLGIGFHSYHAAKIMMPIYFLISLPVIWTEVKKDLKSYVVFICGFLIPIVIFIPWLLKYPDTIVSQVGYLSGIDRSIQSQKGIWGLINPSRAGQFITSYITYLEPKILFLTGDRSLIHSTGRSGAFLFPVVFLLAFGILNVVFKRKDIFSKLVLFGFLTYPIAPSIVNDPLRISRGLIVIPFVIVLSLYGVEYLFKFKEKTLKIFIWLILALSVFQFLFFLKDYFGVYRKESYGWFSNNIGGAMEAVIKSSQIRPVDKIYLDSQIWFVSRYFRFNELKFNVSLSDKVVYFDSGKEYFSKFSAGSLVVISSNNIVGRENWIGKFEKVETIREPDGNESFYLYFRDK